MAGKGLSHKRVSAHSDAHATPQQTSQQTRTPSRLTAHGVAEVRGETWHVDVHSKSCSTLHINILLYTIYNTQSRLSFVFSRALASDRLLFFKTWTRALRALRAHRRPYRRPLCQL